MTITADILSTRVGDVIADMERQFSAVTPALEGMITDVLAGKPNAYGELQGFGRTVIAPVIGHYGLATGTLAADWYDLNRELQQVAGNWSGATLQDPNIDTGPLVGGSVKDFISVETILSGIQSGMELRVRQASNGTIMDSILRDKQALGWGRIANLGCCGFCAMLADRGAVYRTRNTATFCPHEHCECQAVPLWKNNPTADGMRSREDTIATRTALSDDQRSRQNSQARAWIAAHKDQLGLLS